MNLHHLGMVKELNKNHGKRHHAEKSSKCAQSRRRYRVVIMIADNASSCLFTVISYAPFCPKMDRSLFPASTG